MTQQPSLVAERGEATSPAAAADVAGVYLRSVTKRYGDFTAVNGVSLDVRAGEFLTLLGPSGSGKTTTLMMIAGFTLPTSGEIIVGGRDVTHEPPHRRNIGMVFQSYALFPHLDVFRNVAFPLEIRRTSREQIEARVREALDIVHLTGFEHRYPSELSGGQQQRVALARAIVFHPPLLLMDEPLGALDKKLRERMQIELVNIKNRLNITVIYVTHDQEEALVMSDRVVVMSNGVVQQIGAPSELYGRPANRFVADFVGEANILDGTVAGTGPVLTIAERSGLTLHAVANGSRNAGDHVAIVIRPEQIVIGEAAAARANCFEGTLDQVIYVGDASRYVISLSTGVQIIAKAQNAGSARMPATGERVPVGWDAERAWVVDGSEPVEMEKLC